MTALPYQSSAQNPPSRRAQFWCALALCISVFPLIWMGGLVTSHGAGMSVPDWPNSYGYNMFLFPPSQWIGGIFYEHTHRLLGTLSGLLAIVMVAVTWAPSRNASVRAWIGKSTLALFAIAAILLAVKFYILFSGLGSDDFRKNFSHLYILFGSLGLVGLIFWAPETRDNRRWMRWLAIVQLIAIIIQGTLGGLRVNEVSTTLAIVHGCFAQLFFCLTAFTTLASSSWWSTTSRLSDPSAIRSARRAVVLAAITSLLLCLQLIAGATMRHYQAGLAIPDLPLAFGKVLPPLNEDQLNDANALMIWTYHLPPTTFTHIWLHYAHRTGAVLVTISMSLLAFQVFKNLRYRSIITMLMVILCGLITIQFTLGLLTVYWAKPADIASLHVATGALTFMTTALFLAVIARQSVKTTSGAYDPLIVKGFATAQVGV